MASVPMGLRREVLERRTIIYLSPNGQNPTPAHQYGPVDLQDIPVRSCVHSEPLLRITASLHIHREKSPPRDFKDNILSLYINKTKTNKQKNVGKSRTKHFQKQRNKWQSLDPRWEFRVAGNVKWMGFLIFPSRTQTIPLP